MVRIVQSTVNVQFSTDVAADDLQLTLEQSSEWARQSGFGAIAVREFPRINGVTRSASVGLIIDSGFTVQLTRNEYIQFSSESGSTKYPIDNASTAIEVVFAFNPDGSPLPGSLLSFSLTPGSREVKANRPFTGAIRISYFATYRLLAYTPDGHTGSLSSIAPVGDELLRSFGMIISVKGEASATLDIAPGGVDDNQTLRMELYRIVSTLQTNEVGTWEKHEDFDSGGGWSENGAPRDGDTLLEYQRPHEIGYLNRLSLGRVDFSTVTVFTERGPSINFDAPLTSRFHAGSAFEDTPWEDSYTRVDLSALRADIQQRFSAHGAIEGLNP